MAKELPEGFDWQAFTPSDSPKTPMEILADPLHQRLSTAEVTVGGPAYDFSAPVYDFSSGARVATDAEFSLFASARRQPVALIFGSYT